MEDDEVEGDEVEGDEVEGYAVEGDEMISRKVIDEMEGDGDKMLRRMMRWRVITMI